MNKFFSSIVIALLRGYKYVISPLLGNNCRFHPSCSDYCTICIKKHGVLKGLWLGSKRVIKCGPWHPGGIDNPPE